METEQMHLPGTEPTQLDEALALGNQMHLLQRSIEDKEAEIANLKEQYRHIEQELLPEIFNALGIDEIRLQNGIKIKLEEFPTGRLTEATRGLALQWLREHNLDAIIKNTFDIRLQRGEDQLAQRLMEFCEENNLEYGAKEDIHHSTLKAFIKEQAENPGFPRDLFNVYDVKKVKFSA